MKLRSGRNKSGCDLINTRLSENIQTASPVKIMAAEDNADKPPDGKQSATTKDTKSSRFAINKVVFVKPRAGLSDRDKEGGDAPPPPIIVPYVALNNNKPTIDNKASNDNNDNDSEDNNANYSDTTTQMLKNLKATLKSKLDPGDYIIENLTHVVKIHTNNNEAHTKARNLLKDNFEHYTHSFPMDGPKFRKFVIYDLCESDTADIIEDLNAYGLDPIDVKKMHVKFPRFPGHANFLVYFDDADKITLQMVERAKFVCHTKIRWAHYRSTAKVRQCTNCYRFGHLKYGCQMKVVCFLCACQHLVDECPLMINKRESKADRISSHLLKCTNCKGKHTAIDQLCPARINFVNKTNSNKPVFKPAPTPTINAWAMRQNQNQPPRNNYSPAVTPSRAAQRDLQQRSHSPPRSERERVTKSREIKFQSPAPRRMKKTADRPRPATDDNKPANTNTPITPERVNSITPMQTRKSILNVQSNVNYSINSDEILFSPQELSRIFQEVVIKVSKCKNKSEQLTTLMDIALKYLPCLE